MQDITFFIAIIFIITISVPLVYIAGFHLFKPVFRKTKELFINFIKKETLLLAIRVNEFLIRFAKKDSNFALYLSYQVAYLYNKIDKHIAYLKIRALAGPFFNKKYTVSKLTDSYRASLITKILDMYGIYLQSYKKQYSLAHKAHIKALKMAAFLEDEEIRANILPHIAATIIDGEMGNIGSADMFLIETINITSSVGLKFFVYIERIRLQIAVGELGNVKRAIQELFTFLENHNINIKGKYPMYRKETRKLYELLSSIGYEI